MITEIRSQQPIGVFDSGVGGLSVLKAIRQELPHEAVLYLGDQAHIPYGPRTKSQIRDFSVEITRFLLAQGAKLIVVACNTASAAALHELRDIFPEVPFVGMEPAVKPAAKTTHTGKVGILATPTTFSGDLYASLVERFANDVKLYTSTCPGLVEQIEAGKLDSLETLAILEEALHPMLEEGIDTVVLGCTHYPFVIPQIRELTGPNVQTIDPAPAIARQTRHLLEERVLLNSDETILPVRFFTSAGTGSLASVLPRLLCEDSPVEKVTWGEDMKLHQSSAED